MFSNDINIKYFYTNTARKLEKQIHSYFNSDRITNELFNKNKYHNYIFYIKQYLEIN